MNDLDALNTLINEWERRFNKLKEQLAQVTKERDGLALQKKLLFDQNERILKERELWEDEYKAKARELAQSEAGLKKSKVANAKQRAALETAYNKLKTIPWKGGASGPTWLTIPKNALAQDPSGQDLLDAIRGAMEALEACIYADWKDAEDGAKASLAALKKAMGDV